MITNNISTLKIHKLTQAQYDRELAAGNIDENALYLTPDEALTLNDLGVTASATELNYCDGVTSNIQEQLDGKSPSEHIHNELYENRTSYVSLSGNELLPSSIMSLGNEDNRYMGVYAENGDFSMGVTVNGTAVSLNGHTHNGLYHSNGTQIVFVGYEEPYYYVRPYDSSATECILGSILNPWADINSGRATINTQLAVSGNETVAGTMGITGVTTIGARIQPQTDNAVQLGTGSLRFINVYCMKSAMNTSDLNQKRDLTKIDDRYIELFDLIEPYAFYFTEGDRVHTGFISQYVEEAMKQVGLTAEELGFFCRDIKMEYFYDDEGNYIGEEEVYDEDGNPIYVYSLRYTEYIAIMTEKIKRLEKKYNSKLEELEKRLEALEG